jgi:amidohydrolase
MEQRLKTLKTGIFERCQTHFDDIVAIRRDIHMYPEIGFEERRTADIAAGELEKLGIKTRRQVGKTGVVGDIQTPGAERRIALRADMDALPIQELGDAPYKSRIDGKAHMCGHDVHTATLIGAARVIHDLKGRLKANVRFIFQPSEEMDPGGAPAMIEDGALEGVDEIYGLHAWPLLEAGQFGICPGAAFGQSDHFEIEITGRGGHAALPHLAVDPILIGSQFVTNLQSIVSRNVDPLESAVVSITRFLGGTTDNVIPPAVKIIGTVRTLNKEIQVGIRERMEGMLSGMAAAHGARYRFSYHEGYPVTYNHEPCAARALSLAGTLVGEEQVTFPQKAVLGAEDFSYYSEKIPACFINLGSGNRERGITRMCHDPRFDVDEQCMIYGMALHAALALTFEDEVLPT